MIHSRSKLRVNHYLVFRGENLLNRLNSALAKEDMSLALSDLQKDVQALVTNVSTNDIFLKLDADFIEEEQKGTLSMLLLYYLENCVYNTTVIDETISRKMIEKIELFIIYNFSNQFLLSSNQQKTYEKVRVSVSRKLSNYIKNESMQIESHLIDFDKLKKFTDSGKYKLIEEHESLKQFPKVISEEEIKIELENFLNTVFMLKGCFEKKNLPIFLDEMKEERCKAMKLALEYFNRFIYRYANIENEMVSKLEDYIYAENEFTVSDSALCLTKSKLFGRAGRRYVKNSIEKK